MTRTNSDKLFAEALQHIPGGVNSPVRAFRAVGGQPFFVNRAKGAHVWDVDGNELIDYVGTWGPAILGHAHPKIIAAIKAAADHGTSFGIPNPLEVTMAKLICRLVPSVQKVRLTSSGDTAFERAGISRILDRLSCVRKAAWRCASRRSPGRRGFTDGFCESEAPENRARSVTRSD